GMYHAADPGQSRLWSKPGRFSPSAALTRMSRWRSTALARVDLHQLAHGGAVVDERAAPVAPGGVLQHPGVVLGELLGGGGGAYLLLGREPAHDHLAV